MTKLELISEVLIDELKGFKKDVETLKESTDILNTLIIKPDLSELNRINLINLREQIKQYQEFNNVNKQSIIELKEAKTVNTIFYKVTIITLCILAIILTAFNIYNYKSIKEFEANLRMVTKEKNTFKSFILETEQRKEKYLEWYNTDNK